MLKLIGFLITLIVLAGVVLVSCERNKVNTLAKCEMRAMEVFKTGTLKGDAVRLFEKCMNAEGYSWIGGTELTDYLYRTCVKYYEYDPSSPLCWDSNTAIYFKRLKRVFQEKLNSVRTE